MRKNQPANHLRFVIWSFIAAILLSGAALARTTAFGNQVKTAAASTSQSVHRKRFKSSDALSNGDRSDDFQMDKSLSALRKPQIFSGTSAVFPFICNSTTAIRTATFTKSAAASRLRIVYKDTASVAGPSGFSIAVVARIDGNAVQNPTALRMIFGSSGGSGLFGVLSSFTAFGYVNGVAAGTHTFTSVYTYTSNGATGTCIRSDEPFLIEIEEVL